MKIEIKPSNQACGAEVMGVDLSKPLEVTTVNQIREWWLEYHVLSFPNQDINDDDLERFTLYFGPFGDDPFIAPIQGRSNIIAVKRLANEKAPLFADNWHTDWSFQEYPPAGTCLYGITIPPMGGDTLFANQHLALEKMPAEMRDKLEGKLAIHSAQLAYAPEGSYGEADKAGDRSMDIRPSEDAKATQLHPIIRGHPETGRLGVFGTFGYVIGIKGIDSEESWPLLMELQKWQTRNEFIYRHRWNTNTLVMWDNRSVLHAATGGYEGFDRLLHRTTIGEL